MNVIISQLKHRYPEAIITHGYITKENRFPLGLNKDHYIDAGVIASGGKPFAMPEIVYIKKCIPMGDFQKTKGAHSEQAIVTKKIN